MKLKVYLSIQAIVRVIKPISLFEFMNDFDPYDHYILFTSFQKRAFRVRAFRDGNRIQTTRAIVVGTGLEHWGVVSPFHTLGVT